MGELFKTPIIMAAIISGSIAALGTIIQWIIAFSKNNSDTKNNFEKTLKEKLENIYSPIIMQISKSSDSRSFVEGEVVALINKYGYLLSNELLSNLRELHKLERTRPDGNIDEYIVEYQSLRAKIAKQAYKEFNELQGLYNNNFDTFKLKFTMPWYEKILQFVKNSFTFIAGVFWLVFISIFVLSNVKPIEGLTDTPAINFIAAILIILILLTSFFVGLSWITRFFIKINEWRSKRRKIYMPFEYVPQTGIYQCKVCGEVKKFHKYEQFSNCSSSKISDKIRANLHLNLWAFNSESVAEKKEIEILG